MENGFSVHGEVQNRREIEIWLDFDSIVGYIKPANMNYMANFLLYLFK